MYCGDISVVTVYMAGKISCEGDLEASEVTDPMIHVVYSMYMVEVCESMREFHLAISAVGLRNPLHVTLVRGSAYVSVVGGVVTSKLVFEVCVAVVASAD